MTLARKRKSFPRKSWLRLGDVATCVRGRCLAWLGLEPPQWEEAETAEAQVSCGAGVREHHAIQRTLSSRP